MKQINVLLAAIILVLGLFTGASGHAQKGGKANPKARSAARSASKHEIVSPRDRHSGQDSAARVSAPVDAHSGQKRGIITYNGHAGLGSNHARRRPAQSRKVIQDGALTDDEYAVRNRKRRARSAPRTRP